MKMYIIQQGISRLKYGFIILRNYQTHHIRLPHIVRYSASQAVGSIKTLCISALGTLFTNCTKPLFECLHRLLKAKVVMDVCCQWPNIQFVQFVNNVTYPSFAGKIAVGRQGEGADEAVGQLDLHEFDLFSAGPAQLDGNCIEVRALRAGHGKHGGAFVQQFGKTQVGKVGPFGAGPASAAGGGGNGLVDLHVAARYLDPSDVLAVAAFAFDSV
jgi:hypothetical protein